MKQHVSWVVALVVGFALGIVSAGALGIGASRRPAAPPPTAAAPAARPARPVEDPTAIYRVPIDGSPVKGPADALVTIVEFIDFQSPDCQAAAPVLRKVMETYPGKIRLVVKHLPNKNRDSHIAAKASLAAAAQGKYWEMHDLLLVPGARLDRDGFVRMAEQLGLDVTRFATDLDGVRHMERLEQDKALAVSLRVSETPTFYLNGREVAGDRDLASLKAAVDEEVARAQH